ncbi:MAG: DUF2092 domain-containing protein [Cyanobacteriota bacterium]|jgi:hypothetical protein
MIKRFAPVIVLGLLTAALARAVPSGAQDSVDPRARDLLTAASQRLAQARGFSFQSQIEFEDMAPAGIKFQYHSSAQVYVERPNRFQVNYQSDRRQTQFNFDGKALTLWDRLAGVYGSLPAPGNNDQALDRTVKDFDFLVPLADLLRTNPGQALEGKIRQGYYLGEVSLNGQKVHHLGFRQDNLDWQIWIDAGPTPLIRKLLLTYTQLDGNPQYSAVFDQWNLDWRPPTASFFSFQTPPGATQIDFLPSQTGAGKKHLRAP